MEIKTFFKPACLAVLACFMMLHAPVHAGETLYNGIVLPDEWPPHIDKLTREPMPVSYLENRPEVISIDIGRQLFVDDFLIEQTSMTRTYHQAVLHPASPVLRPDKDRRWEGSSESKPCAMVFSDGVWFDPSEGLFKMWYMGGYTRSTCYATSKDGITWEKPSLEVVHGTNIVLDGSRDSSMIWLDHREVDPARRYKMLIVKQRRDERGGVDMAIRYSADGIHWGPAVAERWAGGDRSTFFYNPFRNRWVYSIRYNDKQTGRSRIYAECTDLADGLRRLDESARVWTCADRLDPRNPNPRLSEIQPELYNLDAVAYESLILGLFSVWQGDPAGNLKIPKEKRNEILLGFSRDGFHWQRPYRRPFVGVNESSGAWNWGNIQSAGGCCLVMGDQLYFYVSGRAEDRAKGACTTGLAVLRRDGFASMDAGETTATLTTRLVTFKGNHLFVNADTAGGELRVEILGRDGKPIIPFLKNYCVPMTSDSTLHLVHWQEPGNLAAIAGQPVRFRFHLTHGRLYSFWVSPDRSGSSQGYIAAGGPGFTGYTDTVGYQAYHAAAIIKPPAGPATSAPVPPTSTLPAAQTESGKELAGEWECLTSDAAFSTRDTAENAVFADKMWLSNGWRSKPPVNGKREDMHCRDLWSSTDGVHWTLVSENTPYDVYSEMVAFQGKLWAIKGSVWNSADGIVWHRVLDTTPFGPRGYGEAVVFRDRIWQLGSGQDVWSSGDGIHWTCATTKAPYGDRAATAVAAFDGQLWLMAGRTPGPNEPLEKGYKDMTTHNDVWSSPDGIQWTRVVEHAPWAPRQWAIATVYADRLWLIGGHDNVNSRNLGDVWTTKDGKDWQRFESRTQFAPRHEVTPYIYNGSLWVVAGNTWPVTNDVWRLRLIPRSNPTTRPACVPAQ